MQVQPSNRDIHVSLNRTTMKKQYFYILACVAALACTSCNSDDPADASHKQIYSEGMAPYLRSNAAAMIDVSLEFPKARIDETQVINLQDHAIVFQKQLGMTVDEVMKAIKEGRAVCYTVNTARGCWNLDAPSIEGTLGWCWATSGALATPETGLVAVTLNVDDKSLTVKMLGDPDAGLSTTAVIGIALKNGRDFDDYVCFRIGAVVTDPSKVIINASIPAGDYAAASIMFADYKDAIEQNMGISLNDFLNRYEADQIEIFLSNEEGKWLATGENGTNVWTKPVDGILRPTTTSGWMGWWLDTNLNICNWGDGCFLFIEGGDKCVNIGRYPGIATGTQATLRFVYTLPEDHSRYIEFIVSVTLE